MNCYRCVRVCPVKAIAIKDGQANLIEERCILCGKCLSECPQHAKTVISELAYVKQLIHLGYPVVVSIAPSFAARFTKVKPFQVIEAIKKLGFMAVYETAQGAMMVSNALAQVRKESLPIVTTSCPSVNLYIQKYHPHLVHYLAPIVSPMIAHGRWLKQKHPDAKVVFIGPCLAKKEEARENEVLGAIDAVLTFQELEAWFSEADIDLQAMPTLPGSNHIQTRFYPVSGWLAKTIANKDIEVLEVSGIEEIKRLCEGLTEKTVPKAIIEVNMCAGGCVEGPFMNNEPSWYGKRRAIEAFVKENNAQESVSIDESITMRRRFMPIMLHERKPTDKELHHILSLTGKDTPEQELNCGACGYDSCREKAIAVFQGRAELEMCMPYMQKKAESLANVILEASPNGVLVVDEDFIIRTANPAASKLFNKQLGSLEGTSVTDLMPVDLLKQVLTEHKMQISQRVEIKHHNLITLQTVDYLSQHGLLLCIITDITEKERQMAELDDVRQETIDRTQTVINKQMRVAQEIASLLGETTADTKMLLLQLTRLVEKGTR